MNKIHITRLVVNLIFVVVGICNPSIMIVSHGEFFRFCLELSSVLGEVASLIDEAEACVKGEALLKDASVDNERKGKW